MIPVHYTVIRTTQDLPCSTSSAVITEPATASPAANYCESVRSV